MRRLCHSTLCYMSKYILPFNNINDAVTHAQIYSVFVTICMIRHVLILYVGNRCMASHKNNANGMHFK